MNTPVRSLPLLAALLLALAPGCFGGLGRTPPTKQRFMLAPADPTPRDVGGASVLRVARVRVSPVFENKGFVYRTGSSTFESDFYNEFFSPPGVLLREVLLQWLGSTHLFVAVARGSSAEADWVLETDVDQLYADQRSPSAPTAHLDLAFRLVDARSRTLAFEKSYSASEPAAGSSPAALVDAWNRGLAAVLNQLTQDLAPRLAEPRTSVSSE